MTAIASNYSSTFTDKIGHGFKTFLTQVKALAQRVITHIKRIRGNTQLEKIQAQMEILERENAALQERLKSPRLFPSKDTKVYGKLFEKLEPANYSSAVVPCTQKGSYRWPEDLCLLGLNASHVTAFQNYMETYGEKRINRLNPGEVVFVTDAMSGLPFIIKLDSDRGVLLYNLPIPLLSRPGQRPVAKCYNLTEGKFYAVKQTKNSHEKTTLKFLLNRLVGLEKVNTLIDTDKSTFIVEELYEGTLGQLIKKRALKDEDKVWVILQLLKGLATLHNGSAYLMTIDNKDIKVPFTHKDISLNNIGFRMGRDGFIQTDFIDFGEVNPFGATDPYTPGFRPPEYTGPRYQTNDPQTTLLAKMLVQRNLFRDLAFSRKKDVWALGVVLSAILRNESNDETLILPTIGATIKEIKNSAGQVQVDDSSVCDLTQDAIGKEIEEAKERVTGEHAEVIRFLWDLTHEMLQVNWANRISTKQALDTFLFHPGIQAIIQ